MSEQRNGEINSSSSTREQQFPYPCVAISVWKNLEDMRDGVQMKSRYT
jgi:hypothetical protein